MDQEYLIDTLTTWQAFNDLKCEWDSLLEDSHERSIFLTWNWVQSWSKIRQDRILPHLITVRNTAGQLEALAPLYLSHARFLGIIPYKVLRCLGDYASSSDYPAIISRKNNSSLLKAAVLQHLHTHTAGWDLLWLPNMAGWGDGYDSWQTALDSIHSKHFHVRPKSFGLTLLPETMAAFLKSLSKKSRTNLKYLAKQSVNNPDIEFRSLTNKDEIEQTLNTLYDLHNRHWNAAGLPGAFNKRPALGLFYDAFAPIAFDQGWLSLNTLTYKDEPIAIQIGFIYNDTMYAIQEGYDPDAIAGAGNYLRYLTIEQCISQGLKYYDFLQDYTKHKKRWGAELKTGYDFLMWAPKIKTIPFYTKKFWPSGRFLKLRDV